MLLAKLTRRLHDFRLLMIPLIDQAIISVTNFAGTIFLVAVTDLTIFGQISYFITLGLIGQSLIFACIIPPMNILAVQNKREFDSFLSATLVLMFLCAALIAAAFYIVLLLVHGGGNLFETLMFCVAFISMCVQDCSRRQLYLRLFRWLSIIVTLARYAIPVVFLVVASRSGWRLTPTEYWQLIAGSSLLAMLIQFVFSRPGRTSLRTIGRASRQYVVHGGWLFGGNLVQLLSDNAFFLISGGLLPIAELGIWRSLQTVTGFLNPALVALENIIPARAQQCYQDSGKKAGDIWLKKAFLIVGIPFFIVALTIAVWARQITSILFPSIPLGWEWIAQSYCAILFLQMIKFFIGLYARLYGRTHAILSSSAACLTLSLLLCYPLTKYFGIQGSVLGLAGLQVFGVGSAMVFLWLGRGPASMEARG